MNALKLTRCPQVIMWIACAVFPLMLAACQPVNATIDLPSAATRTLAPTGQVPPTTHPTPLPSTTSGELVLDLTGVAQNQTVETIAAVPPTTNAPYWNAAPQHERMILQGYPVTRHLTPPQIFVYPAADFIGVNETAVRTMNDLQNLLEARQPVERMPFLPLTNELQAMHVQVQYLDFQDGKGVRFLTQFNQGPTPINNVQLIYTFQGFTSDGNYYIAAVLPVTHPELPPSAQPADDVSDFSADMAKTVSWLEQQPASSFTPNLTNLDVLIQSIEVK